MNYRYLVGANTRIAGCPRLRSQPWVKSLWNAGNKNPQVLPLPVLATVITSRPFKAIGQAWAWVGVGFANPAASNAVNNGNER